jgi:hypothetical protein
MVRTLLGAACLAFSLALVAGCSQSGGGGSGPKLANPDNTVFKDVQKKAPGGGGVGGQKGPAPQ